MGQKGICHSLLHLGFGHLFLLRLELKISQLDNSVKNTLIAHVVTSFRALGLASSGSGRARLPAVVAICCGMPAGQYVSRKHVSNKLGMAQRLKTKIHNT